MTEESAKILQRLMALCSRGEKCSSEARQYMLKHGATDEEADLAVEYLTENLYIDDHRFARAYAADKFRFNKWGRDKITMQLKIKKIPQEAIENAIEEIFDCDQEKETISNELAKKLRGIKNDPKNKIWEKLMRFSISRGYSMQVARPIIDQMIRELQ
ncbi:MAG: RecX family transcriptional regulator [Bacteroidales bacterium]|nr:RecX family transcriptional regulator [Bacteroidales bacterium]